MTASASTEHLKRTARPASSSRDAVQTCHLAMSSAASTKRPAITPVNLPERRSSSDPGTNGRRSRCCLRISRPRCASSECASEGWRAPGTSSCSRPSPRTSGAWRDWRRQRQLERPRAGQGPQGRYPKSLRSRHQQQGQETSTLNRPSSSTASTHYGLQLNSKASQIRGS
jgi:hypothetical protein